MPKRRCPPNPRRKVGWKFRVDGQVLHVTVGLYEDQTPCEIWLDIAKEGSSLRGMTDCFCQAFSYSLQWGVPLEKLVGAWRWARFEPAGGVNYVEGEEGHPDIARCTSIPDLVCQLLYIEFLRKPDPPPPVRSLPMGPADYASYESQSARDQVTPEEEAQNPDPRFDHPLGPSFHEAPGIPEMIAGVPPEAYRPTSEREKAILSGYEGDPCPECQAMKLKRTGPCVTCQNCNYNSGCS